MAAYASHLLHYLPLYSQKETVYENGSPISLARWVTYVNFQQHNTCIRQTIRDVSAYTINQDASTSLKLGAAFLQMVLSVIHKPEVCLKLCFHISW